MSTAESRVVELDAALAASRLESERRGSAAAAAEASIRELRATIETLERERASAAARASNAEQRRVASEATWTTRVRALENDVAFHASGAKTASARAAERVDAAMAETAKALSLIHI